MATLVPATTIGVNRFAPRTLVTAVGGIDTVSPMGTVADRIRVLLTRLDISERELSRRAGLAEGSIGKMLKRGGDNSRGGSLTKIARATGVSIEWLADGKGDPGTPEPAGTVVHRDPEPPSGDATVLEQAVALAFARALARDAAAFTTDDLVLARDAAREVARLTREGVDQERLGHDLLVASRAVRRAGKATPRDVVAQVAVGPYRAGITERADQADTELNAETEAKARAAGADPAEGAKRLEAARKKGGRKR